MALQFSISISWIWPEELPKNALRPLLSQQTAVMGLDTLIPTIGHVDCSSEDSLVSNILADPSHPPTKRCELAGENVILETMSCGASASWTLDGLSVYVILRAFPARHPCYRYSTYTH